MREAAEVAGADYCLADASFYEQMAEILQRLDRRDELAEVLAVKAPLFAQTN